MRIMKVSPQFFPGSIPDWFGATESKGNVYDFSVDYSTISKSKILNIHRYFMVTNNIK